MNDKKKMCTCVYLKTLLLTNPTGTWVRRFRLIQKPISARFDQNKHNKKNITSYYLVSLAKNQNS